MHRMAYPPERKPSQGFEEGFERPSKQSLQGFSKAYSRRPKKNNEETFSEAFQCSFRSREAETIHNHSWGPPEALGAS